MTRDHITRPARRGLAVACGATLAAVVALAPSASARSDAGDADQLRPVRSADPLKCSVAEVADRLVRCDYLVARLR